mmetsp:Transcript_24901/g.27710  ORF Transcript_24901/g.27710 Transcript_24901/m.27710 type:complete len:717 (+) Transcript_24901:36-2186(+)
MAQSVTYMTNLKQILHGMRVFTDRLADRGISKRVLALCATLVASGSIFAVYKRRQFEQQKLARDSVVTTTKSRKRPRVAVDGIFVRRMWRILKIIIPSFYSKEFMHLLVLTGLLICRTILSIKVADITGLNAQYIVQRRLSDIIMGIVQFGLMGIPASIVNSGLKYETSLLSLYFRKRLSATVEEQYLDGVSFYKASNIGENKIDNADQRITRDVETFCQSLADLYTTIFKPGLDVILYSYKLGTVLGAKGPMLIFAYFIASGLLKRVLMPPFGKLSARQSELEGDYRMAHQRLITNSEEVAFYDGAETEKSIISRLFHAIFSNSSYLYYLKAMMGVFDEFLLKYGTSITGYVILSLPVLEGKVGLKSAAELTRDYVSNRQLLINLAKGIAQLVVLSNKVTSLAGLTARVAELLEMVKVLKLSGSKPFKVVDEAARKKDDDREDFTTSSDRHAALQIWLEEWRQRGADIRTKYEKKSKPIQNFNNLGGKFVEGESIIFTDVSIVNPDGRLLVKDLNFEINPGTNVMVSGPNGSGKSSLFRILGELWPLHSGVVVKPRKFDILFVPQKPYLVLGTLRDQIIYPHSHEEMLQNGVTDEDLAHLLELVDPHSTIMHQWGWDEVKDWFNAFSGGQKQRVAMARVYYHRPRYAVLDECTSAVSSEVEGAIYETCKQVGITLFTVSHRKYLRKFHDYELYFDGYGGWEWNKLIPGSQESPRM